MKKYAIAGTSHRGLEMYAKPLCNNFQDVAVLVGAYDPNYKRAEVFRKEVGKDFPLYNSFEEMMASCKPDIVIITTVDAFHCEYVIKALEAGCDAIVEKPMTIDAEQCNTLIEVEKRTGRKVTVTFNARFNPFTTRIKEILKSGEIGEILSVHFEWLLDTVHGADYFRRWHSKLENSGGLLIHKSTHHFDLVNWFIEEDPVTVNAFGTRRFYGPTRENRGKRCLTCEYKKSCEFYFDITKEYFKTLYLDCEDVDGYMRDRCLFSEEINIYDSMSLNVKYSKGTIMSYSLTAHSPYEGYKISINGSKGRLEAETYKRRTELVFAGDSENVIRLYNRSGEETTIKVPILSGGHGGADERLHATLFKEVKSDPLGHCAGSRAGVMSVIIGAAANMSIKEGRAINVKDILNL